MTNDSFLGGVLLISGVVGFFFWPAWVITGVIVLILSSGSNNPSEVRKKENTSRPATQQRTFTAHKSDAVKAPDFSAVLQGRTTELPKRTHEQVDARQFQEIALPEVQSDKIILASAPSSKHVALETVFAPNRTLPGGSCTNVNIAEIVKERRIKQLVHFTRCENLGLILERGLLSVTNLEMERIGAVRNDVLRLDEKRGAICLSVSAPNYRMFYKYRCEKQDAEWVVLRLNPAILWELDCLFYQMNAADHRMRHRSKTDVHGPNSFAEMFGDVEGVRPSKLYPCYPTDVQAEVLVTEPIEPGYILSVAFETLESHRRWEHLTANNSVTIEGQGTGLFGARERG